jgi:hypothetical protein
VGWLRGTLNLPLPWLHEAQVDCVLQNTLLSNDGVIAMEESTQHRFEDLYEKTFSVVWCWLGDPQLVGSMQGTLNLPLPWLHDAQVG